MDSLVKFKKGWFFPLNSLNEAGKLTSLGLINLLFPFEESFYRSIP